MADGKAVCKKCGKVYQNKKGGATNGLSYHLKKAHDIELPKEPNRPHPKDGSSKKKEIHEWIAAEAAAGII